jgi:hypothetical protein
MIRAGTFGRQDHRILLGVFVLAFAVAVITLGSGRALANHVDCGDTITADTTLDNDLLNCPNNGIIIGADDVTFDLNYHTIDGDGAPAAGCDPGAEFCDVGVLNDGHNGVAIVHGSVRQFAIGVFVGGARHNRMLGVSSARNEIGIVFAQAVESLIQNSSANRSVEQGLVLFRSDRNRVRRSSFRHNGNLGVIMNDGSSANVIRWNWFSGRSHAAPIVIENGDRNRVSRNRCFQTSGCIVVAPGDRNRIGRNHVFRSVDGIAIEDGRGNRVAHNSVRRGRGVGIRLGLEHPRIGGADNVIRRNLVRGKNDDAFLVSETDHDSILRHNIARRAGDDGFDVESRSTKLTGNLAVRNADLGIEAVRGVIDGGGNIARGNGDPRQCTGVFCG